ncbi:hypothetical protein GCM10010140_44960 [Streptosporangium pseudovulgare]|uniref:Uncharacterized protein n=1 Tax=Streptosporangium pseudovulgare TaxID=35765 RepID=A0ABQ2R2R8_9ACTN|nr:hypothetical protein GCM10010140_44960 [Streptosporangium pseudovulgare]
MGPSGAGPDGGPDGDGRNRAGRGPGSGGRGQAAGPGGRGQAAASPRRVTLMHRTAPYSCTIDSASLTSAAAVP